MMDHEVNFGEWLRRRRRGLDLTQQELAKRVGCGVTTIRKIEAGERRPSKALAAQLVGCLELAPEEHEQFITFARLDQPGPTGRRGSGEARSARLAALLPAGPLDRRACVLVRGRPSPP